MLLEKLSQTVTNHLGVDGVISGNRCTNRDTTMLNEARNVVSAQRNQELNEMYTAIETINQEIIDISEAENLISTPTVAASSHYDQDNRKLQFPRDLRKVQKGAIEAIFAELYLLDKNRATVSMVPRIGKCVMVHRVIGKAYLYNKENSQTSGDNVYVIVTPGRELARQTAKEIYDNFKISTFSNNTTLNPSILIVSSGTSVKVGEKKYIQNYSVSDFDKNIDPWIKDEGCNLKIIITIYKSFDNLLDKFTETGRTMDLIADEAHNLTESIKQNNDTEKTSQLLDDESGTIGKRLFMTGTPVKTKYKNNKIRDKCFDRIYSMDNKKKFGEVVYTANFQDGLDAGALLKPEIILPNIADIDKYIEYQKLFKGKKLNYSHWFQFTVDFFIDTYKENLNESPIKKVLWYVQNSKKAHLLKEILEENLKKHKLDIIVKAIYTGPVGGKKSTQKEIKTDLEKFIEPSEKPIILINIDLVSEGITTKECDTIFFGEQVKSAQKTVQRFARATQSDPNNPNKICRILIPTVTINTEENGFQVAGYHDVIRTIKKYLGGDNWCEKYVKTSFNETDSNDITVTISNDNIDSEESNSESDSESETVQEIDDDDIKTLLNEFAENCLKADVVNISESTLEYISIDRYKELLRSLNINTIKDYFDKIISTSSTESHKQIFSRPDIRFKVDWVCWDDLFENEELSPDYKDYIKTRAKVHKLVQDNNITNIEEYNNYYNSCENHENDIEKIYNISGIPKAPSKYYQGKNGWIDYKDWLGIDDQMFTIISYSTKPSKKTNELTNLKNITSLKISSESRWLNNMNKIPEIRNDKTLCNLIKEISDEISEIYSVNISNYSYNFRLSSYNNDKINLIHLIFYTGKKSYCAYNIEDTGTSISTQKTLYEMTNQLDDVSDLKEQVFMKILERCRQFYCELNRFWTESACDHFRKRYGYSDASFVDWLRYISAHLNPPRRHSGAA